MRHSRFITIQNTCTYIHKYDYKVSIKMKLKRKSNSLKNFPLRANAAAECNKPPTI